MPSGRHVSLSGSHAIDRSDVNNAVDSLTDELTRLRFQHRSETNVDLPAKLAAERSSYGVDPDRAALLFFRAAVTNVGGDRLIDDTVHHHVGIFRIHPDVHPFDLEDFSGLDPDHELRVRLHRELERFRTQRSRAFTVRPDAVLEMMSGDDQLRILDRGLRNRSNRSSTDIVTTRMSSPSSRLPTPIRSYRRPRPPRRTEKCVRTYRQGEEKKVATCSGSSMRKPVSSNTSRITACSGLSFH